MMREAMQSNEILNIYKIKISLLSFHSTLISDSLFVNVLFFIFFSDYCLRTLAILSSTQECSILYLIRFHSIYSKNLKPITSVIIVSIVPVPQLQTNHDTVISTVLCFAYCIYCWCYDHFLLGWT